MRSSRRKFNRKLKTRSSGHELRRLLIGPHGKENKQKRKKDFLYIRLFSCFLFMSGNGQCTGRFYFHFSTRPVYWPVVMRETKTRRVAAQFSVWGMGMGATDGRVKDGRGSSPRRPDHEWGKWKGDERSLTTVGSFPIKDTWNNKYLLIRAVSRYSKSDLGVHLRIVYMVTRRKRTGK